MQKHKACPTDAAVSMGITWEPNQQEDFEVPVLSSSLSIPPVLPQNWTQDEAGKVDLEIFVNSWRIFLDFDLIKVNFAGRWRLWSNRWGSWRSAWSSRTSRRSPESPERRDVTTYATWSRLEKQTRNQKTRLKTNDRHRLPSCPLSS